MEEENLQGSLEELGIPAETTAPEGVLTPAAIKTVSFTQTRPRGYHFTEVEEFVDGVDHALTYYADALHQRDLDVHKLGRYADRLKVNNANLEQQLTSLTFKLEQRLVKETDSEVETLVAANKKLQERIMELEAANANSPADIEPTNVDEYVEQIEALTAANISLQQKITELENLPTPEPTGTYDSNEVADLLVAQTTLQARIDELEAKELATQQWEKEAQAYVLEVEEQLEAYKNAYESLVKQTQQQEYTTPVEEPVLEVEVETPVVEPTPTPQPQTNVPGVDPVKFPNIRPEDLY